MSATIVNMSAIECKHGALARNCEVCELQAENARLAARGKELEAAILETIKAIESLPEGALGFAGDDHASWPIRNEMSYNLKQVLLDGATDEK